MGGGRDDVTGGSTSLEQKVDRLSAAVDLRFDQVDRRFEQVDRRFEQVDAALVEQRAYTQFAYQRLDAKMDAGLARLETKIDASVERLERKMDQFIDTQTRTNALVERRLQRLERQAER
jgi:hypothetical protein